MKKGFYQHYKGGMYEVLFEARHSETLEDLIVYKQLRDDSLWRRPKRMWMEMVEKDGKMVQRFVFLNE